MFKHIHAVSLLITNRRWDHLRPGFKDANFAPLLVFMHVVGKPAPCITAHARRPDIQACAIANRNQTLRLDLFANRNQRMPKAPILSDDLAAPKMQNQFAVAAIFILVIQPDPLAWLSAMEV